VDANDVPVPGTLEQYIITAHASPSYDSTTVVEVAPAGTTRVVFFAGPEPPSPPGDGGRERATRVTTASGASEAPRLAGGLQLAGLRADDASAVWQIELLPDGTADFERVAGSSGLIQNPALSREFPGRLRYVTYVSDETGDWQLYVQRLAVNTDNNGRDRYEPDGLPYHVPTPGSLDNLSCTRSVFYPRFVPASTGSELRIVVGMGDCPNNGFEDLGYDDDPWALGEYRLWEVTVQAADVP